MKDQSASTGDAAVKRWYEKAITYKVSALVMITAGSVLAWRGNSWVYPTFIPFLAAWILCFFLGLALSKMVRDRTWMSQKQAATIFLVTVALSCMPLVFYGEDVANAMVFPAIAAMQGIGTAIGFHMPWLHGGKASHTDVEGIDDLMATLNRREK